MAKQLHEMSQLDLIKIIDIKDETIKMLRNTVFDRNETIERMKLEATDADDTYNDLVNETMHQS